jgi:hypothetical protein
MLDILCNWLAFHPRLTCALICAACLAVGMIEVPS